MADDTILLEALRHAGIGWTLHEHAPVFTVEESAQLHADLPGMHTKNLFLKDAGGQFWIVTAPHDASVDLKSLPEVIGAKKVSFGKPEAMAELLGVSPGAVTPLAAMNDTALAVNVVIDSRLAEAEMVWVHPLRNTASIGVSGDGLISFLRACEHPPQIVPLPARP